MRAALAKRVSLARVPAVLARRNSHRTVFIDGLGFADVHRGVPPEPVRGEAERPQPKAAIAHGYSGFGSQVWGDHYAVPFAAAGTGCRSRACDSAPGRSRQRTKPYSTARVGRQIHVWWYMPSSATTPVLLVWWYMVPTTAAPTLPAASPAERLRIRPGAIVLTITRTYHTSEQPVETADNVLPAERYALVYEVPVRPVRRPGAGNRSWGN